MTVLIISILLYLDWFLDDWTISGDRLAHFVEKWIESGAGERVGSRSLHPYYKV